MLGLQSTLEIARRALRAHQLTIGVLGNNIANVETRGFSRRRVELSPAIDIMTGEGILGTGVDVLGVTRVRDRALDGLYREHTNTAGRWGAMQETLARVESAFPANDDGGLGKSLTEFYASWNDLANQPENRAARVAVREKGRALVDTFHRLDKHMDALLGDVNDAISEKTARINDIASRVAQINDMVIMADNRGQEASSLLDERDMLLDELSEITDTQVDEKPNGAVAVTLGAEILVQGGTARQVEFLADPSLDGGQYVLRWTDTRREPAISGGRLAGLLEARDTRIDSYRQTLDGLAATLVTETNRLHTAGTGLDGSSGNSFFGADGVTARDISLDAGIEQEVSRIAASAGGERGDGRQALAIAQLATAKLLHGGTETLSGAYRSLVGQIGFEAGQAKSFYDAQDSILATIDSQRAEISGVSLDEEMTNMIAAQHAYQAMVKVTSTIDDMLNTLITQM